MPGRAVRIALPPACTVCALAGERTASGAVPQVSIDNGSTPFAGDSRTLTTISPNGDGFRDRAYVRIRLVHAAAIRLMVGRGLPEPKTLEERVVRRQAGAGILVWAPAAATAPDTYRVVVSIGALRTTLLVRVQGIDAAFTRGSSPAPGRATLTVRTDAAACRAQIFRIGRETARIRSTHDLRGTAVDEPFRLVPCGSPERPLSHHVPIGP
jgi:hypothetical protein